MDRDNEHYQHKRKQLLKKLPIGYKSRLEQITCDGDLVYYLQRVIVPQKLREPIMRYYHTSVLSGHAGSRQTQHQVEQRFWWPGINLDILDYVKACYICQSLKVHHSPAAGELQLFPAKYPFQVVHLDIVGKMPTSTNGYRYVLTMMDRYTSYVWAVALKDKTAETVASAFFTEWICRFGCPDSILADQGSEFCNYFMNVFMLEIARTPFNIILKMYILLCDK